ncbi:MAG TPA: glycoside hydrolase family 44 protein [Polyangiales bacterium]|nr:glycoside hydrolase family 44 protein [Polyangiales bacterium]
MSFSRLAPLLVLAAISCSESRGKPDSPAFKTTPGFGLEGFAPGDPGQVDVTIDVRTDADVRTISPLIYGTNGAPDFEKNGQGLVRAGGNRYTAYNWETNASNAGSDYQFQNDGLLSDSNEPAKVVLDLINKAQPRGATTLVTVPIVDYVAGDKQGGGDVRNSGVNYLSTRFKRNKAEKGGAFGPKPDTSDGVVYQDEFVHYLKSRAAQARIAFSLDNEPDLWASTHAEVHPRPVTYAELWDRNQRFAQAIKHVWPSAEVLGLVSYGWNGFVNLQNAPDARGRDLVEWYLEQAKDAEHDAKGKRVIDYLDLHWYPEAQANGTRVSETSIAPDVVVARVQAPRSLWDPTYEENSWVRDFVGGPIDLLHRMSSKIAAHYPGTKLSFSEWNYGAGHHISGAIATADVLGIFGREGVGMASIWPLSSDESFTYAALRAFRNYDGKGGAFGDVSVRATTTDVGSVTAYASLKAGAADQVVVIAINKASAPKTVGLIVNHPATFPAARVWELSGTAPELVPKGDLTSRGKNTWRLALPAYSISVVVPHV